jgi:LuxR family maltose regulon positive regulatory protein
MAITVSPGLLPRPALFEQLERGASGPVTVVAASAGSGKTMLVRSWLLSYGHEADAAWVSVDRSEKDPQHFWEMVVAAINEATAEETVIAAPEPTPTFNCELVVGRLLSELASLESRLFLVFDDLHEFAAPDALAQLRYFLDHLPPNLHVVLISRRDPQLNLHRRRLAGELTEIRTANLRFTLGETQQMLSMSGVGLSSRGITRLHERTEGWIAGLRLAAMSLSDHPDPEQFITEFTGSERTVAEYLFAEVLEGLPARVRRLLTRTSILGRVNGPLGDLLTGGTGAEHDLRELADAGGFVIALDASRTSFRLHHLFADLLAVELRNTEPGEIANLHAAAANWYAEHDDVIHAITHAQAAGDSERAAGLLIENYFSLTLDGRRATARTLLDRLDPNSVAIFPELAIVIAAEQLLDGSLDQAEAYLGVAEDHAGTVPHDRKLRFEMALLVTRLSLARRRGDFRSVLDKVSFADEIDDRIKFHDVGMHNDLRVLVLTNLGIVEVWSGRFDEGAGHLTKASELARQVGRPYLQIECKAHLANVALWRSVTQGEKAARDVIKLAESHGWAEDPVIGAAVVVLQLSLLNTGRLDEAERWINKTEETLRPDLEPALGLHLRQNRGALYEARGMYAEAIASSRDAQQLGSLLVEGTPLGRHLRPYELRVMITAGGTTAVRLALAQMSEAERETSVYREVLARLALAEGDPNEAIAQLAPVLDGSAALDHEVENQVVMIRSLILDALAHHELNETAAAEASLERALGMAEPDRLILLFVHTPCRELLERHLRHRTAYGALIGLILDVLSGVEPPPEEDQRETLLEPLSDAETRLLRYLPTNLSAAAIAAEMYVSVHTVKTYFRHIYFKLDVHTRADAVRRARQLGLIRGTSGA